MKRNWSDVTDQPRFPEPSSMLLINELGSDGDNKIHRLVKLRDEMMIMKSSHLQRRNNSNSSSRVVLVNTTNIEDLINKRPHLFHYLISSATSVDENNVPSAIDYLTELYQHISLTGDSSARLAAYFTDALTSILLTKSPSYYHNYDASSTITMKDYHPYDRSTATTRSNSISVTCASSCSSEEYFMGFTHLYRVSPYYQFIHFTANQAILEAFEKEEDENDLSLHVIDFELSYGFQWPSMIQSLSEKATRKRSVSFRITGFATSLEELVETEARLVSFSKGFDNLNFEFLGLLKSSSSCNILGGRTIKKKKKKNETVAVNLAFHLSSLDTHSKVSDTLKAIHSLDPSIVVLVEKEGNDHHIYDHINTTANITRNTTTTSSASSVNKALFLSSFMDSLHYYEAMFDSLDICLPRDSSDRFTIEKNYLGKEIKQEIFMMANHDDHHDDDDDDDDEMMKETSSCFLRYEKMESWKGKMASHGFVGIELSSRTSMQAKLLLRIRGNHCHHHHHPQCENGDCGGGFRVCERDQTKVLSLGWQDRFLVTVSAWHPASP